MKKNEILELIIKGMPFQESIENIDTETNDVHFDWRGHTFSVSESLLVLEVMEDGFSHGNNLAILVEQLLKKQISSLYNKKRRTNVNT